MGRVGGEHHEVHEEHEVEMKFDELSNMVLGCAIEVHRELGPGLLESAYEQCLAYELNKAGIRFQLQVPLPVEYKQICSISMKPDTIEARTLS